MRRGDFLIGHGMAVAARGNLLGPSKARVRIEGDGRVTIETEMTDIGTGTYTVLAQIAADLLGVPMERVDVKLGDTDNPASAGSGGSWGAATSGSAVYAACQALREKLAAAAGCRMKEMSLAGGYIESRRSRRPISELVGEGMQAEGSIEPGKVTGRYFQASYGAHFCEIGVNIITGETRVLRWNSVFAAGRIINLKTATSQCIGGVIFGIGAALTEELVHDTRSGKIVNRDLAEYHIPTHADIPEIDVHFLDERDRIANPLHSKGLGELGISGAGAAVVNAIYNATGVRARDLPVTLDKIFPHLP
jgi:xanthine dehydrogenase YagR molybdenum-binding subunit